LSNDFGRGCAGTENRELLGRGAGAEVIGHLPQDEIKSLVAGARKAAECYRANPDKIARMIVIDLYLCEWA
jgi:hypothetical protein